MKCVDTMFSLRSACGGGWWLGLIDNNPGKEN